MAYEQAAEAEQPGVGALDDPAVSVAPQLPPVLPAPFAGAQMRYDQVDACVRPRGCPRGKPGRRRAAARPWDSASASEAGARSASTARRRRTAPSLPPSAQRQSIAASLLLGSETACSGRSRRTPAARPKRWLPSRVVGSTPSHAMQGLIRCRRQARRQRLVPSLVGVQRREPVPAETNGVMHPATQRPPSGDQTVGVITHLTRAHGRAAGLEKVARLQCAPQ